MGKSDEDWMAEAIALVTEQKGTDIDDGLFGALVVRRGELLASGVNLTKETNDATAHAEVMALRSAGAAAGSPRVEGATLYATLQPCGMCTMAAIWAGIGRIVYGAGRGEVHEMYFEDRHLGIADFVRDAYKDDLEVRGGVLAARCAKLYHAAGDDVPKSQWTQN